MPRLDLVRSPVAAATMSGTRSGAFWTRGRKKKKVKVPCSGPNCGERRVHHEQPDTPRGTQMVEVPTTYHGPVFCSMECKAYYDGVQKENK